MKNPIYLHGRAWRHIAALIIIGLLVTGCQSTQQTQSEQLSGAILIWHDLGEDDATVLDQVLANFMEIHPEVRVNATAIAREMLRPRFEDAVASGLGPDLLLGPSSWIKPLADKGFIRPVDDLVEPQQWEQYIPAAITATQYDNKFYAIPESLRMMGLYYNKSLVESPATTLDELMEQVTQGAKIGMSPEFLEMFWGIRAFGGELLNAEGQVTLNHGGFANWLAWLVTAQDGPNFLIDRDRQTLRTLFRDRELAYIVDGSWAAQELRKSVGEDQLGVAPLPAGPIGPASPLLEANAFMLSVASSQRQSELALELATFITNPEQATTLMRRGDRIPASNLVRISPTVDPIAFPFFTQARNAIPYRNSSTMEAVVEVGSGAYNNALQGVEQPVDVANKITQAINEALGVTLATAATPTCLQLGVLNLWYVENDANTQILRLLIDHFRETCPYIVIDATGYNPETLYELLVADTVRQPDVALVPSQWVAPLAETDAIRSLTGIIPAKTLQAYQPSAVQSWLVDDRLYGVPHTLEIPALYYNKLLVSDPARTLDELMTEGAAEQLSALNVSFADAYWGVSAFGGKLFDAERRAMLDQGGLVEWLVWLQDARDKAGALLDTDEARLLDLFLNAQVTYYVGGPEALAAAEAALGKENVGVTQLPTGPVADAAPLLTSLGFVIPSNTKDVESSLALLLIQDAADLESQSLLMTTGRKAPVNVAVDFSADQSIAAFLERANSATIYPNVPEMAALENLGAEVYAAVLDGPSMSVVDLEQLIADITTDINRANKISEPLPEPTEFSTADN